MSGTAAEANELPDVDDVRASGPRVLGTGLVIASATMLVAEMFMALVLRSPVLLLVAAPITVVFVLTAGTLVGWAAHRLTVRMSQRNASLVFFVAGFAAGAAWGYPVFSVLISLARSGGGPEPSPTAALIGAVYMGSTAGLGGLAGRYFAPWMVTKPRLVAMATIAVLTVTGIGVVVLS